MDHLEHDLASRLKIELGGITTEADIAGGARAAAGRRRARRAAVGSVLALAAVAGMVSIAVASGRGGQPDTLAAATPAAFDRGFVTAESPHAIGTWGWLYPLAATPPVVSWSRAQELTTTGLAITKEATGVSGELGRFSTVDRDGKALGTPVPAWVVRYHNAPLAIEAEYVGVYGTWPCDAVTVLDATTGAVLAGGKDCHGPYPETSRYAGPPGTGALPAD